MVHVSELKGPSIIVRRKETQGDVDHVFIACLECRFQGSWHTDRSLQYTATGDSAEVRLVRLDGTRLYIAFRKGAYVTLLTSNVLTYEEDDVTDFVGVADEQKR